jgi:DNA-binding NarL/FixJ family response regulator
MAKVLIVEDDLEIRNAYAFSLSKNGFEVLQAGDAEEGLDQLRQNKPDVMLLDMLMPGASGVEFLRNNHIQGQYPDMKVIAFSNIDNPKIMEQAKALGAIEYLVKVDVTPSQMVEIIRNLTSGKSQPAA